MDKHACTHPPSTLEFDYVWLPEVSVFLTFPKEIDSGLELKVK